MSDSSAPGELPPPHPRGFFGRDDLIKRIVPLAKKLTPIALVGAGGIGKTSLALAVLHDDRIKAKFGEDRRFIRCDQFPTSRANFLSRLSKAIGAGVESPDDLNPLRSYLSSKKILIVLDNAESILDPRGVHGGEIYGVVEELSRFKNVCLCITSRITTVPSDFETFKVPTLSVEAARETFYHIYKQGEKDHSIDGILRQLDFHPLSITLLATIGHQNDWDCNRLVEEWKQHKMQVLQTEHNQNLGATIELSLASPMFRKLGPGARELLEVIAFYPQGVNEKNIDWLLPTIPNRTFIFDVFCILSLTYRSDGFITMLEPLRDYLHPTNPLSCGLILATRDQYFARMSVKLDPCRPGFKEAQWITSEDANVEHLLDVLTSIDAKSENTWMACARFVEHLRWHKPRQTVLGPAIEELPDNHPFKPNCLSSLSRLFRSLGNFAEVKRILDHILKLEKARGNDQLVADVLSRLSDANRTLGLHEEGIRQAKEAAEIFRRLGDRKSQATSLTHLSSMLRATGQFDQAIEAAFRAIDVLPETGEEILVCNSHFTLGGIYVTKGERGKAFYHFDIALEIASAFNLPDQLFWIHSSLARHLLNEGNFEDARSHIEQAKRYALDNQYYLARAISLHARILHQQRKVEETSAESLRAYGIFEELGEESVAAECRAFLHEIERSPPGRSDSGGGFPRFTA